MNKNTTSDRWDDETVKYILVKINKLEISISGLVDHSEKLESLESKELQKIVVLGHDFNESNNGGYTHITSTTIGRLYIYMKAFEMADIKYRITSEIDVSRNNLLTVLRIGVIDFHHTYFKMLYSIVQSEEKNVLFLHR